jgi:hypothetical protein
MQPGRKWRRTAVERNGRLVPLSDDWSLIDEDSGFAIARIWAERRGWSWIVRTLRDDELRDSLMGWFKTGPEAREYCEGQTSGLNYKIRPKRTKEEILRHAGVR